MVAKSGQWLCSAHADQNKRGGRHPPLSPLHFCSRMNGCQVSRPLEGLHSMAKKTAKQDAVPAKPALRFWEKPEAIAEPPDESWSDATLQAYIEFREATIRELDEWI